MSAVGDLVRSTAGAWMVRAPEHLLDRPARVRGTSSSSPLLIAAMCPAPGILLGWRADLVLSDDSAFRVAWTLPEWIAAIRPASMIIMSNNIETLLLRNLEEVFGEGDPERRRSAIEELYTEDCVVNLPVGQYHGHDALDRICGELRAGHPAMFTPHITRR
jgi:hypothetical protein